MWAIPFCSQRQLCWRASAQTDRESQSLKCNFKSKPSEDDIRTYLMDDSVGMEAMRQAMDELRIERDRLSLLLELTKQIVWDLDLRRPMRISFSINVSRHLDRFI